MAGKIVHHDQVARIQGWDQEPLTKTGEAAGIDRAIQEHRSADSIQADRLNKGARMPLTTGYRFDQPLASRGPAAEPRQIRLKSHFVQKDKALWIDALL